MVSALFRPSPIAFLVMVSAAGLVWAANNANSQGQVVAASPLPESIGEWKGTPVGVDARTYEILETKDVTLVEYAVPEEPAVLFARVGGFGKNRAAFHPPEICFAGADFEIRQRGPMTVELGGRRQRLMRLVIAQEGKEYETWYWFTANGRVTPNYYQQQWWLFSDLLKGRSMYGTLVRISTSREDPIKSQDRLNRFLAALAQLQIVS
ncbi:MAG: EpsI family protein [Candidatus Omnitrophica bacterium]|nr:EpsI family protein [Candidatus Omnitrophota bacterium]